MKALRLSRPLSARAVARRSKTYEEFGYNLRDWFHELSRMTSRVQLQKAVQTRPPRLARVVKNGDIADAFLAAQVEWISHRAGIKVPHWTQDTCYVLDRPWFSVPDATLRVHLLLDTPDEFRNRNIFTTSEVRLGIRRGRPRVATALKRDKARLRQQRYRARLAASVSLGAPLI